MAEKKVALRAKEHNERIYNNVLKDLRFQPAINKYGFSTVRWAVNRFIEKERSQQRLEREIKEAEQKLNKLKSSL